MRRIITFRLETAALDRFKLDTRRAKFATRNKKKKNHILITVFFFLGRLGDFFGAIFYKEIFNIISRKKKEEISEHPIWYQKISLDQLQILIRSRKFRNLSFSRDAPCVHRRYDIRYYFKRRYQKPELTLREKCENCVQIYTHAVF